MQTQPAPHPANPADALPRAIYYQIAHELRRSLPDPVTDTQEDTARRDFAAMAHVASLLPANFEEANIAVQYVAAGAQALDSLRLARQYPADPEIILKCTAQSASMMRQARSWRAVLTRTQAAREQRDNDAAASAAAARTEHRVFGLLADALAEAPPVPEAAPVPVPQPAPVPEAAENPPPTPLAQAERYALQHRKRAALIRSLGRLPDKLEVGALPPQVVHIIATGTTPILQALGPRRSRPGRSPPSAAAA